jgi:hypothetical protein
MRLSKNFTLEELSKSNTAERLGIKNTPKGKSLENIKILVEKLLQPLRDELGSSIYISSGFRSKILNLAVGGAENSFHCKGMAADIDQDGRNRKLTNRMIFDYIKDNMEFTELIWEFGDNENPSWVHVAYDKNNLSKEVLYSYKTKDGRTKYKNRKTNS